MEKGQISNKFAPVIVIDLDLILKKRRDTTANRLRNLVGLPKYRIISGKVVRHIEEIFNADYSIYILERKRNDNKREKYIEDMAYTKFISEMNWHYIREMGKSSRIANIFLAKDFEIGQFKKAVFVDNWNDIITRMRMR